MSAVTVTIVVQWGEMDALGHVNNARYFAWFESARIALFQRIGVATTSGAAHTAAAAGGAAIGPILATTTCDFLKPVVYPATIAVTAKVSRVGETSLSMQYEIKDANGGELYARGTSVAVLIDYGTMNKVRVPDDVRAAIGPTSLPPPAPAGKT
jgi:acyl-CoA thioester hydrolase